MEEGSLVMMRFYDVGLGLSFAPLVGLAVGINQLTFAFGAAAAAGGAGLAELVERQLETGYERVDEVSDLG
jgi:hypothetical protein